MTRRVPAITGIDLNEGSPGMRLKGLRADSRDLVYGLKSSSPKRSAFEINNRSAAKIKVGTASGKRDLIKNS